jgi:hypothetical protein
MPERALRMMVAQEKKAAVRARPSCAVMRWYPARMTRRKGIGFRHNRAGCGKLRLLGSEPQRVLG